MNRSRAPTTPSSSGMGGRSWRPRGGHSGHSQSPNSVGEERLSSDGSSSSQKKPEHDSGYSKHASGFKYEPKKPSSNGKDDFPELGKLQHDRTVSESTPIEYGKSSNWKHMNDHSPSLFNTSSSQDTGKAQIEVSMTAKPDYDLSHKMNMSSSSDKAKKLSQRDAQFKHSLDNRGEKPSCGADSMGFEYLDMEKLQIRESLNALPCDSSREVNISSSNGKSKQHDNYPSQKSNAEETVSSTESEGRGRTFDICVPKIGAPVMLKPSLFDKNRESRRSAAGLICQKLRPGMVFLKSFLSLTDQIKIVKMCRELGLGSGGFYQPGYRDGAKLNLKMMCLGKNWDPETNKYEDRRTFDGAKPPAIPHEFCQIVGKAMEDAHALIRGKSRNKNVEEILPSMSPDICIMNFYLASGKLGLHQDRDESQESLRRGLPVVSFSIGDSAEFLYGDQRDLDKADKVLLESGDVLIFGGKSRHIFHGVASITPKTAPHVLLEETNLRAGRLNLTFREY